MYAICLDKVRVHWWYSSVSNECISIENVLLICWMVPNWQIVTNKKITKKIAQPYCYEYLKTPMIIMKTVSYAEIVTYRHLTYISSHYYWVNTPRYITQNPLSNNISTKMYFKSKTKQYLLWCVNIVMWLITLCLRFLSKHYSTMDGNIFNSGSKYLSCVCKYILSLA